MVTLLAHLRDLYSLHTRLYTVIEWHFKEDRVHKNYH